MRTIAYFKKKRIGYGETKILNTDYQIIFKLQSTQDISQKDKNEIFSAIEQIVESKIK